MEYVYEYPTLLRTSSGEEYLVRVYADQQPAGTWEGWFAFFPFSGGRTLVTDRETTQSKLEDVTYWATGIGTAYLEGALTRALQRLPEVRLLRHMARAEAAEAYARAEENVYSVAAEQARGKVREAEAARRDAADQLAGRPPGGRRRRRGRAA